MWYWKSCRGLSVEWIVCMLPLTFCGLLMSYIGFMNSLNQSILSSHVCIWQQIKVLSLRETKLPLKVLNIEEQIRIGVLEWIFFSNLLHFPLAQVKTRIRLTSLSFPYSLSPNFEKTWLTLPSNTSRIPMSIGSHLCFLTVLAKQPVGSHSYTYDLYTIMFGIPKVGGKQTNKPFFPEVTLVR